MAAERRYSFLYRNGLTIAFLVLMIGSLAGHVLTGWRYANEEREEDGRAEITLTQYTRSGEFLSSLFENWESEFLQMGLFVLLTVWLRQRGSSESRPLDPRDEDPPEPVPFEERPWPVRRGGLWLTLYKHSLSIALFVCFVLSFLAHFCNSWRHHAEEQFQHGQPVTPMMEYVVGAQFWFESFQNWQSEFLAVVALSVLSIYLREKDSPQSKDVHARHSDTGA